MNRLPCLCLWQFLTGDFVCVAVVHPEGRQVWEGALDTGMGSDSGTLTQTGPGGPFNPPNSKLSPNSCGEKAMTVQQKCTSLSPSLQATQLQSLQSYKNKAVPAAALLFVHLERAHSLPVGPPQLFPNCATSQSHDEEDEILHVSLFYF